MTKQKYDERELTQLQQNGYQATKKLTFLGSIMATVMATLFLVNILSWQNYFVGIITITLLFLLVFSTIAFGLGLFATKYLEIIKFIGLQAGFYIVGVVIILISRFFAMEIDVNLIESPSSAIQVFPGLVLLSLPILLILCGFGSFRLALLYLQKTDHELTIGDDKAVLSRQFKSLMGLIGTILAQIFILISSLLLLDSRVDLQSANITVFLISLATIASSLFFLFQKRWKFHGFVLASQSVVMSTILLIAFLTKGFPGEDLDPLFSVEKLQQLNAYLFVLGGLIAALGLRITKHPLRQLPFASRQ